VLGPEFLNYLLCSEIMTTDQGVVQLSGVVDSKEQRDEAVRVAKSVPGVRGVDNGLQLRLSQ